MDLSEDGKTYHIKSNTNKTAIVDVKWTQSAPGFVVGKNGKTLFGTDKEKPWGSMRHAFWPRCRVEGTGAYTTTYAAVAFNGFPPLQQIVI